MAFDLLRAMTTDSPDAPEGAAPEGSPPLHRVTPYERLGGADAVARLVHAFYDLMDSQDRHAQLRALHSPSLDSARERLIWFLSGWLGGPQLYVERLGHPRLRARHLSVHIAIRERDQWLACMDEAMHQVGCAPELRAQLNLSLFQTADWMRNLEG